jgi:hypothetical protein
MKNYRQGDVLLKGVQKVQGERQEGPLVLAEGDSSAHHHTIIGGVPVLFALGGRRFLTVGPGAQMVVLGDEKRHEPIGVEPGAYEVVVQRAWDAARAASERVED